MTQVIYLSQAETKRLEALEKRYRKPRIGNDYRQRDLRAKRGSVPSHRKMSMVHCECNDVEHTERNNVQPIIRQMA